MAKIALADIDRYEDESTVEKFKKKKESNPKKRHNKKGKKHHQNVDIDWDESNRRFWSLQESDED